MPEAKSSARLLYFVNEAWFFLSHRRALAEAARQAGYEVHVATPLSPQVEEIYQAGFQHHVVPLTRRGLWIWEELASLWSIYRLYRRLQPDLVHHITIKPIIYGGLMAQRAKVPAAVFAVTGLGHIFTAHGPNVRLLRAITKPAYRIALQHANSKTIFQNPDDLAMFHQNRLVSQQNTVLIRGSGVNMQEFKQLPEPTDTPTVILAARMLWSKGVGEFVAAAERLHGEGFQARFVLVGDTDLGNPQAIPTQQLQAWHDSGVVEWWGYQDDMTTIFAQANLVCLPSSYGEGLPKVLIEAAASGRALVATDIPGCREIVRDGENGLLVPTHDIPALVAAIRQLINDPERRQQMGQHGREIAENEFSIETVNAATLAVYQELMRQ